MHSTQTTCQTDGSESVQEYLYIDSFHVILGHDKPCDPAFHLAGLSSGHQAAAQTAQSLDGDVTHSYKLLVTYHLLLDFWIII